MLGDSGRLEEGEGTWFILLASGSFQLPSRKGLSRSSSSWFRPPASFYQPPGIPQRCPHQPVLRCWSLSPPWTLTERPSLEPLRCQPSDVWVPALWVSSSELSDADNPIPPLWFSWLLWTKLLPAVTVSLMPVEPVLYTRWYLLQDLVYLIFLTGCLLIKFPKTWCPGCGGGREAYTSIHGFQI